MTRLLPQANLLIALQQFANNPDLDICYRLGCLGLFFFCFFFPETMILISLFHIAVISALLRHACHSCLLRGAFFRWGKSRFIHFLILLFIFFNLEHLTSQRWPTYYLLMRKMREGSGASPYEFFLLHIVTLSLTNCVT